MEENKVFMANVTNFGVLLITPNEIKHKDWASPNYLNELVNGDYCKYLKVHPNEYVKFIGENLLVQKYKNPNIKVQLIFEEKDYVTEIMYVDMEGENEEEHKQYSNEFAMLLNINEDKIYNNVIITRSFVSSDDDSMHLDDITPIKLENSFFKRANTTVVVYDSDNEEYKEDIVFGPLDVYAEVFFGEKKFNIKKIELPFLKHNLNIWYTEDKYGTLDVFGNILPDTVRVDKMIVFSMWSEDFRDSFHMEEFNKIKFLSKKLTDYDTPPEYNKEEKDSLGRDIIKNKYKVLNSMYNIHKK
jgi:hypothetical protein